MESSSISTGCATCGRAFQLQTLSSSNSQLAQPNVAYAIVDRCGHERCYFCVSTGEPCVICLSLKSERFRPLAAHHRPSSENEGVAAPPTNDVVYLQQEKRHQRPRDDLSEESFFLRRHFVENAQPLLHSLDRRRRAPAPSSPLVKTVLAYGSLRRTSDARQRQPQLSTMGQRFGRQQQPHQSAAPSISASSTTPSSAAAVDLKRSHSLLKQANKNAAADSPLSKEHRWTPVSPYAAAASALTPETRPYFRRRNESEMVNEQHFRQQYLLLKQQQYATLAKNPVGGRENFYFPQHPHQQMRTLQEEKISFGHNLGDNGVVSTDRPPAAPPRAVDAYMAYEFLQRADRRQLAEMPATPRLVRSNRVRQQSATTTPPVDQQQMRIPLPLQHKNGRNCAGDGYGAGGEYFSYPTSSLSRTVCRGVNKADFRAGEKRCGDLPPPSVEEAQNCLAAHLNGIYNDYDAAAHATLKGHAGDNFYSSDAYLLSNSQIFSGVNEEHVRNLGSTDVLLNSQHQYKNMPSSQRHQTRCPPAPLPPHQQSFQQQRQQQSSVVSLRQSQESLMSLMSTSTTSVVPPAGHNMGAASSAGSGGGGHSPMLSRGMCRHSHNYGHNYHRTSANGGASSSCSSRSSECNFGALAPRRHMYRRSARNLNVRHPLPSKETPETKNTSAVSMQELEKLLRPSNVEVPCVDADTIFVGREWIFHELYEILVRATMTENGMKGAIIYGGVGTGKTAVIHQLASYSPFIVGVDSHPNETNPGSPYANIRPAVDGSPGSDRAAQKNRTSNSTDSGFVSGSKLSLNNRPPAGNGPPPVPARHFHVVAPPHPPRPSLPDWHQSVCQSVAAYHFCQIDNQVTCTLPEFLLNIAAMFANNPNFVAYRQYLAEQKHLLKMLTAEEMMKNPVGAFRAAVTEPLTQLRKCGKIGNDQRCQLVLIDGLDEAEFHRPEFGDSIASFLVKNALNLFPEWMKLVVAVKSLSMDLVKGIPLHKINLDNTVMDERVLKDSLEYIRLRISHSTTIQTNVSNTKNTSDMTASSGGLSSAAGPSGSSASVNNAACPLARFADHLASIAKGNFLYLKLTLNLIDRNYLVMKGANYKVLPINLSEVFLLMFNLRFPTARSFERVASLLNVVLASLRPLTVEQLYGTVSAGAVQQEILQEDFEERLATLQDYLVRKQDNTYVIFHPAFREWLIRREDGQSPKYLCDLRHGHALLALRLSRAERRLEAAELQEFGHHLLKAHIYKHIQRRDQEKESDLGGATGRDCQLLWINQAAADIRTALCTERNACFPNSKVSRLLLLAGASADAELTNFVLNNRDQQATNPNSEPIRTPLLCAAAFYGQQQFASLLLEFEADVCAVESTAGRSPLMLAAAEGHLDMVQLLHQHNAKLSQIDKEQKCALVCAAERGHADVVSFLLQCDWTEAGFSDGRAQETSMATSTYEKALRQQAAQQAFVVAAAAGKTSVCEFLLDCGEVFVDEADPVSGETALSAACAAAKKEAVGFLLNVAGARAAYGRQPNKPTPPLLHAVSNGCWEIVSTLLARQIDVDGERNGSGQTALIVAAQHGHIGVVELLLSRNVNVAAVDDEGRSALCWACLRDQPAAAGLLMDRGAVAQINDIHGFGPIHYAAQHGSKQTVQLLLDRCPQLLETPTTTSSNHLRPLELAILADNLVAVQRFLKKGAKLAPSTWTFARDKPPMIVALLNKLLEDGQLLYKRNRLADAQHRFSYALKKMASCTSGDVADKTLWSQFAMDMDRLRFHLLINHARCLRKTGDAKSAAQACTEALLCQKPTSAENEQLLAEAYICRARCFCEMRQFQTAVDDLRRALRTCPSNREAQQLLPKVKSAMDGEKKPLKMVQNLEEEPNSVASVAEVHPAPSDNSNAMSSVAEGESQFVQASATSPNGSHASSSDSGNMPDIDDGEFRNKGSPNKERQKSSRGNLETEL